MTLCEETKEKFELVIVQIPIFYAAVLHYKKYIVAP